MLVMTRDLAIPSPSGKSLVTYLDWNAGAPLSRAARRACLDYLQSEGGEVDGHPLIGGNPSSLHRRGRANRGRINAVREKLARRVSLCGAHHSEGHDPASFFRTIFTSGGTEANAWAGALGFQRAEQSTACPALLLLDPTAHPSLLALAESALLPPQTTVSYLRVHPESNSPDAGTLDLDFLETRLKSWHDALPPSAGAQGGQSAARIVVAYSAVNSETGVMQPMQEVYAIASAQGAVVFADCAQLLGRTPSCSSLHADIVSCSSHKFGGLPGVGAVHWLPHVTASSAPSLLKGGKQEFHLRAGTENVLGIVALGAALDDCPTADDIASFVQRRQVFESKLTELQPTAQIVCSQALRVYNTTAVILPGHPSASSLVRFDLEGICVSAGSACSSGALTQSHVLAALAIDPDLAACVIRISWGVTTTDDHLDRFLAVWATL